MAVVLPLMDGWVPATRSDGTLDGTRCCNYHSRRSTSHVHHLPHCYSQQCHLAPVMLPCRTSSRSLPAHSRDCPAHIQYLTSSPCHTGAAPCRKPIAGCGYQRYANSARFSFLYRSLPSVIRHLSALSGSAPPATIVRMQPLQLLLLQGPAIHEHSRQPAAQKSAGLAVVVHISVAPRAADAELGAVRRPKTVLIASHLLPHGQTASGIYKIRALSYSLRPGKRRTGLPLGVALRYCQRSSTPPMQRRHQLMTSQHAPATYLSYVSRGLGRGAPNVRVALVVYSGSRVAGGWYVCKCGRANAACGMQRAPEGNGDVPLMGRCFESLLSFIMTPIMARVRRACSIRHMAICIIVVLCAAARPAARLALALHAKPSEPTVTI